MFLLCTNAYITDSFRYTSIADVVIIPITIACLNIVVNHMVHVFCIAPFVQVTLPQEIGPRDGHIATVFGSGSNFRMVVMFGGKRRDSTGAPVAETTILYLGKCAV